MFSNVSRAVRALRQTKPWSQGALAARADVSRQVISRLERGKVSGMTLGTIESVTTALGATLHVQVRWHGERLDQLLDAAHAAIQQRIADLLTRYRWIVHVEVSFNHYGDRGRIDIVAYHPRLRVLLVLEIKSALGDLQETLGRLDVKVRVARQLARELGWTDVAAVIPALIIGDSRAARRIVAAHDALFARFDLRGRAATAWLHRPLEPVPAGLLWFANRPDSREVSSSRTPAACRRRDSHVA